VRRRGSNFAGLTYPFIGDKLKGKHPKTRFVAAEPAACPTLTRGVYAYDFGDAVGLGPVVKMFTLGHSFVPDRIHSGGLRTTETRRRSACSSTREWSRLAPTSRTSALPRQ